MKLEYRYAVIGWCPDLTDPSATAVPAGIVLVGTLDGTTHLAATLGGVISGELDPVSAAILRDVPDMIRRHVDDLLEQKPAPLPHEVLESLHHSLRNSLSVLSMPGAQTKDIPGPGSVNSSVVAILEDVFDKDVLRPILRLQPPQPASALRHAPVTSTGSLASPLHPCQVWELQKLRLEQDRAKPA